MPVLHSRCEHYIFCSCGYFLLYGCPVVSSFFLFFLAYSQLSQIGCLPYFHTWRGLSANLECRTEMCCTWLAENIGRKKLPKIHHVLTIAQLYRAISSQLELRHMSALRKNLLNSTISSTCSHFELRPTNSWDRFWSLGHATKFQRVSHLGFVNAPTSRKRKSTKLCTMFDRLLGWYTMYTFLGAFARCKINFVSKSCFSYIGSIIARRLSSGYQSNFAAFSRGRHLYSAGQPLRWHRPTF